MGIILKYCAANAPVISLHVIDPEAATAAVDKSVLAEVPTVVHVILSGLV